ncbi:DUF72 domain-containing protein [Bordetella holmesii]|uniref:PF01904 family protein n=1 Tax=Bordetella holmesii CDC-H585-BH TaxID=1331206 RepID=A0A158LZY2_9BORD|nr:DUF72 domain-containing protein [Bordetella holmesii]AIT27461.1 hypothetical protein D558_2805 [Bordetella holmesii 44057]EWM42871.1 hypothetical protein D556_2804 [Bordetella holmesii 41130]EWM48050.1 hypothetical protein D555_2846 [Bordetella holmesii 35009]AMD46291.1 hypothetical protein H558_12745 [Bordetella holmesii H558]AMD48314.1 hypothetical protein F783_005315 [Bordetella holmesii F627]
MSTLIGTASWTDPTLLACGRFYPPQARNPESRLRFYATRFGLVEADAAYYALPSASVTQRWAERTPPGFVFNIKAFRLFTGHQTPKRALPAALLRDMGWDPHDPRPCFDNEVAPEWRDELWRQYLIALEPLRMAGKLGLVHCQFPPWIQAGKRAMAQIETCARHLDELDASIELRHRSWFADPAATRCTLDMLRERRLIHTVADTPQGLDNSVPAVWASTNTDLALVRLHGRNAQTWNAAGKASSSRFQYEYSEAELSELADGIARLQARRVHVVLNTNYQDQGVNNAARLLRALR